MASLGKFFWLAVVWAVHGLILMLIMTALLDLARSRPRILYWPAVLVLPVLFTLAQSWLDLWFVYHLSVPTKIETLFDSSMVKSGAATTVVQNFKVYIWLFGFYAAVIALLDAAHSSYEARLEVKDAQLEAQQNQLYALRLQIAPHFLFNALNALSALVVTGRTNDAEAMIERLSNFYRSSLLATDSDLIPLHEEMDAVSDYLEIERVRFGGRLEIDIDMAEDLPDVRVPALVLQPLVENAIKHGVARTSGVTELTIRGRADAERLLLSVVNDLPNGEAQPAAVGTGSGLVNVRRRLATLYGSEASLTTSASATHWEALIALPLAPQPVGAAR
ncbi:hypothetical protein ASD25_03830 [Brevundimonas sp. Root1423]|nr:hypothetical protein ASD25_03830 [Brevundimonas sp. Root1423]